MPWFTAKCPVVADERAWIDENLRWCLRQFGALWLYAPVVLPTDDFFPEPYAGTEADVLRTVEAVCGFMAVDRGRVTVEFHAEGPQAEAVRAIGAAGGWSGAAGHYRVVDGKPVISLEQSVARQQQTLVATVAHELAHERLLGERRISPDRPDHEPLTDLVTVFLGLGVFTANASLQVEQSSVGGFGSWSWSRQGYLTEPMFGYALARYAWLRGEVDPAWAKHVDANPRSVLRRSLRFLKQSGENLGPQ